MKLRISACARLIENAVSLLVSTYKKEAKSKNVILTLECLEKKLLLSGMSLFPHRPLLTDGGVLTGLAFTPYGHGMGVFNPGDSYTTSNEGTFSFFETGFLDTFIGYSFGSPLVTEVLSEYTITLSGTNDNGSFIYSGTIDYSYDFTYGGNPYSDTAQVTFTEGDGFGIGNILYTNLVSSVLYEINPGIFTSPTLIDIVSSSTGTFSYSYEINGISSVEGDGTSLVPFLPPGSSGVDTYQYSGITTYTIEKTGTGTVVADNWFKIDGPGSYSTLPDYELALICYGYERDATLSVTSTATTVFNSNGTVGLIFSTDESFAADGNQAGGSYSYADNYDSSGRETYNYSGVLTEIYHEHDAGSLSEDSEGTYSYSGSTPTHTALQDVLIEMVDGTYTLDKYSERDITEGTGQRLSTYTSDALGTTSNGLLLTDGTFTSDATRSDAYSFSGTANSTTSYEGAASSTWNRPLSFTQSETYSYSASYEESREGSGSSLQTMLATRESEGTFSHAGFTFTQEGRIDSRELQSRSYSESSSATGTSSGEGETSLYQFGMPRSGNPSMSSFAYSANGTSSLLSYDSLATMEFTGTGSSRETFTQTDDATLNRLSPFLETVTSDSSSQETYSSASTYSLAEGVVVRSSSGSYTETFTHNTLGTYAGESYSLSSVTFDSLQTGSNSYSESQGYDITSGTHLGTFTSYAQSLSTLSAAAPATLLGLSFAYSTASGTSSYTFEGTYRSEALGTTSYSESNLRRGTYSLGSYSYSNLENHADGVTETAFEATNIQEITAALGTYLHDSTVSVSSTVSSSNNGWEHSSSSDNFHTSTGTTTLNFTQYSRHHVESSSQGTYSRDEYGSASHMTLSLTSINYQETGTGLVTTSVEVRNHSTSLMTSMEEFFYNNSESLELTGAATGFDFTSSSHSGYAGCLANSTATLVRHNESRSTFTAMQVADYANSQGMLGEYQDGLYSFPSMAYQSTATLSSLATATSLNTLLNKDVYRMLDAMPDSNGMSMNSDPGDGAVGSSTSSSSGNSIVTYINNLRVVTDTTDTNASSGLETYSSLGQYANFSTSLTSFSHRSSGLSLSTMNFTEMLTGTMSESSLGSHASESGSGSSAGSGVRNGSGASTGGGLSDGGALYTYNTETTGYAYSSMVFNTRQEGSIPSDLGTELTYYESRVTLSAEQYAEEVEIETEFTRTMTQTDGTSDDTGSSSLNIPQLFSGPYEYEADDRTNDSSQTLSHGFEAIRTGMRETFAEQFRTSYEYGTYSEGDYNLSCATYYSMETATVSFSYTTVLENEINTEQSGYNHRVNNWAFSGSSDRYTADNETHTHDTIYRSIQTITSAGSSSLIETQFEQGVYAHGSYSYSSIAYDSSYFASTSAMSVESSMFTTSEYSRRTVTDTSATQNLWNYLNRPGGFVLVEWFAEFTQSLAGTENNTVNTASQEQYTSVIRGTSSGQDFSFSLINSTYEATTTDSTSIGTSSTSSFTGYHTTGLVGVYRDIEGEISSSVNVSQTRSTFINKQHLGSMYDGVACVVYDKTLSEASETITNSSSYVISYEGDHADFDVYSYDSSDVTITNGYSMQEYSEVSFDPAETDPWSLVSYAAINTVTSGYTYEEESVFNLWQLWTFVSTAITATYTYDHERERTDEGSVDATMVEEKYGYSEPDGSGGYSFVFDDYSITNGYTEDGDYTNVGFAEYYSVQTAKFGGPSSGYNRYDWDKERERDGSGSESISGATSGDTFVYGSYSKNFTRDDTGDYFGVYQTEGTGSLYHWGLATLIYDETLEYRHTADLDEYEVSIDFAAPWTLTYENDSTPLQTMTGATLETHTDSGEDAKETPPPPMPLAMGFQAVKDGVYYGLRDNSTVNGQLRGPDGIFVKPGMEMEWLDWLWKNGIRASARQIGDLVYIDIPAADRARALELIKDWYRKNRGTIFDSGFDSSRHLGTDGEGIVGAELSPETLDAARKARSAFQPQFIHEDPLSKCKAWLLGMVNSGPTTPQEQWDSVTGTVIGAANAAVDYGKAALELAEDLYILFGPSALTHDFAAKEAVIDKWISRFKSIGDLAIFLATDPDAFDKIANLIADEFWKNPQGFVGARALDLLLAMAPFAKGRTAARIAEIEERIRLGGAVSKKPRPFGELMKDAGANPSKWEVVKREVLPSTNSRNRGGTSVQEILRNTETGEEIIRHTLLKPDGSIFEPSHFRPFWK